jgi:erythromycin esterase
MKLLHNLLLIICVTTSVFAQEEEKKWLTENVTPLSIDSLYQDMTQFENLKEAIGESRIVLLGEETHGDGTTFETKARVIKYLHENMGFNVLAFESDMYNAETAWKIAKNQSEPMTALRNSTFSLWGEAKEVQPLLKYIGDISKSKVPLSITGFDCQGGAFYNRQNLFTDFNNFLFKNNIPFKDVVEINDFYIFYNKLIYGVGRQLRGKSSEEKELILDSLRIQKDVFVKILNTKIEEIEQLRMPKNPQVNLFSQFWKSTRMYLPALLQNNGIEKNTKISTNVLRDSVMAENLIWLVTEKYPKEKIIVWAASYHIAKHETVGYGNGKQGVMGDFIRRKLDKDTYSIGFTAYDGEYLDYRNRKKYPIDKPSENSFEEIFHRTGIENFFLDFKSLSKTVNGKWLSVPRIMRPFGYSEKEKDWTRVFDAIIFNNTMKSVNYITEKK